MNTPKNKLEEVARLYADNQIPADYPDYFCRQDLQAAFIAGAKWHEQQMMKEAVEKTVGQEETILAGNPIWGKAITLNETDLKGTEYGDKIRIIIVKEEK